MKRPLDLSNVRIYSNAKQDIVDAIDLIGEEVYLADRADFGLHTKAKLTGVICAEDDDRPFSVELEPNTNGDINILSLQRMLNL